MSVTISQYKPASGAWYAKNTVPKLMATANENITVIVYAKDQTASGWPDSNIVFKGSYSPDYQGEIWVDFGGLFDASLSTTIPGESQTDIAQAEGWCYAGVRILDSSGAQVGSLIAFQVVNAVLKSSSTFEAWAGTHFLTNQPIEKPTNRDSLEWLTYLDTGGDNALVVRFYKPTGYEDVTLKTDAAAGMYTVNVSYSILESIMPVPASLLRGYYDIILNNGKGVELCRQRYIYEERSGMEHYFHFVNALGGVDTLICTGANTLQPEVTHNIGRFSDSYMELDDTDDRRQWQQQTGKVPHKWRNWIHELLSAKQGAKVYEPETSHLPIVLTESEVSIADFGELGEATFVYILDDIVNAISDQEYADDRSLHQSVANEAGQMEDDSVEVPVALTSAGQGWYESGVIELPATKLYVSYPNISGGGEMPLPIYVIVSMGGGISSQIIITPGSSDNPYIINKQQSDTVQFRTQNTAMRALTVNYYPSVNT